MYVCDVCDKQFNLKFSLKNITRYTLVKNLNINVIYVVKDLLIMITLKNITEYTHALVKDHINVISVRKDLKLEVI